jgi:hypothetical protein
MKGQPASHGQTKTHRKMGATGGGGVSVFLLIIFQFEDSHILMDVPKFALPALCSWPSGFRLTI